MKSTGKFRREIYAMDINQLRELVWEHTFASMEVLKHAEFHGVLRKGPFKQLDEMVDSIVHEDLDWVEVLK